MERGSPSKDTVKSSQTQSPQEPLVAPTQECLGEGSGQLSNAKTPCRLQGSLCQSCLHSVVVVVARRGELEVRN